METEVNGGSYYKETDSKKTDGPDTGDQTNSDVGEMSPPKNVPSPNSSSTRKKLRVDGVLPKRVRQCAKFLLFAPSIRFSKFIKTRTHIVTQTLARSNSRTASLRKLLPDETAVCFPFPTRYESRLRFTSHWRNVWTRYLTINSIRNSRWASDDKMSHSFTKIAMQIFRGPPLQPLSSVEPGPARTKLLIQKLRLCSVPQAVLLPAAARHLNTPNANNPGFVCVG